MVGGHDIVTTPLVKRVESLVRDGVLPHEVSGGIVSGLETAWRTRSRMGSSGWGIRRQIRMKIGDSEINVSMSWVWDGGIDVRLDDAINGFLAEENVPSTDEIVPWLQEAIAHFYPDSTYAKSLPAGVAERTRARLYLPPQAGEC